MDEIEQVLVSLTETIAWCSCRPFALDSSFGLRDKELRPPGFFGRSPAERAESVAQLVERRVELLRYHHKYPSALIPDLAAGRLLLHAPDGTLSDGAAEDASHRYLDVDEEPPWETWVWYAGEDLLAWVPPQCIELVEAGLTVSISECTRWAERVDTRLTRELRLLGLL